MAQTAVLDSVRVFDQVLEILIGVANRTRSKAFEFRSFTRPARLVESSCFEGEEVSGFLGSKNWDEIAVVAISHFYNSH